MLSVDQQPKKAADSDSESEVEEIKPARKKSTRMDQGVADDVGKLWETAKV